ncbi:MAG: mechanosensitive ion channel family protein [Noviherbaspirillum sp.]
MTQPPGILLWPGIWSELRGQELLLQAGVVLACLFLAWLLARPLRGRLAAHPAQLRVIRFGVESFAPVLWPLLALALLAGATLALGQSHPVRLLRLAMPLLASFASIRLILYLLRHAFARDGRVGRFLQVSERSIVLLVWGAAALYITGLWPGLVTSLEQTMVPLGRNQASLLTILQAVVSVAATLVIALWAGALLEERLMRLDSVHASLRAVMARSGRGALILVAILLSLSLVGIDLTVLSVFGGALGVGLGLGLQKIVSSYFSGFVILIERSLAIGDVVTVDKYSGRVTRINTRYTVLRGADGVESVVPNEMLVSGVVQNYSLSDRRMRLSTRLTVSYGPDIDAVLDLLKDTVSGVARVCQDPAPQALLLSFGADGMEIEIGFWIADPENGRANLLSEVNRILWQALRRHRIGIPGMPGEAENTGIAPPEQGS